MDMLAGRYRIDELAGSGGFGDVYRGYDMRMDRPVAVKRTGRMGTKEAEVLRKLDNSRLPELLDIIHDAEHTYIVMEWIDGTDLEKYIEQHGAIPENRTVQIGEELLEVLGYLHSRRPAIVYQDLKPANIMLKPDGHICLVDLGTALIRDYAGRKGGTAGTPGYGSPEQRGLTGTRRADERSDIYAWGAVMYSCMSGRLLNRPPYAMSDLRLVCPQISFGFAGVIKKAVRRDSSERYRSTEEVSAAVKHSGITDILYRSAFILCLILCACPFILCWIKICGSGTTAALSEAAGYFAKSLKAAGPAAAAGGTLKKLRTVFCADGDRYLKQAGMLAVTGACMIYGFIKLQFRKFIRVNRSVYLSERKFPGLWMAGLVMGITAGLFINGSGGPGVSRAAEMTEGYSNSEGEEVLPVSIIGDSGELTLLRYGSTYRSSGNLNLRIDRDVLDGCGASAVTVTVLGSDGCPDASRTIPLECE